MNATMRATTEITLRGADSGAGLTFSRVRQASATIAAPILNPATARGVQWAGAVGHSGIYGRACDRCPTGEQSSDNRRNAEFEQPQDQGYNEQDACGAKENKRPRKCILRAQVRLLRFGLAHSTSRAQHTRVGLGVTSYK